MQTGLKSTDAFCSYNQSAAPFFWTFQPSQYKNNYTIGEVGVIPSGGSAGSYIPPNVIDVSSFLMGIDTVLSKCVPPTPSLDSIRTPVIQKNTSNSGLNNGGLTEKFGNVSVPTNIPSAPYNTIVPDVSGPLKTQEDMSYILLPKYTKELRSVNSIDAIDFNRFTPSLPVDPQDLRFIIEDFAVQRGGMSTRDYVKSAWSNRNNSPSYNPAICGTTLDPNTECGPDCTGIALKSVPYQGFTNKLTNEPNFPFKDPTPEQMYSLGMTSCSPRSFYGPNYDQGSCPPPPAPQVFKGSYYS